MLDKRLWNKGMRSTSIEKYLWIVQFQRMNRERSFVNLHLRKYQSSFINGDCTCRRKILQSLVAWDVELCHLQYACRLSSSGDGIVCDNWMLPFLSNSSKIRSHLETSNVNFSSACQFFWIGLRDGTEPGLAFDGQTNSAAYTSLLSSSELSESWSRIWVLDRWGLKVSLAFLSLYSKPMTLICK